MCTNVHCCGFIFNLFYPALRIKTGSALDPLAISFWFVLVFLMTAVQAVAVIAHGRSGPPLISVDATSAPVLQDNDR
jgi:hypothetical protein